MDPILHIPNINLKNDIVYPLRNDNNTDSTINIVHKERYYLSPKPIPVYDNSPITPSIEIRNLNGNNNEQQAMNNHDASKLFQYNSPLLNQPLFVNPSIFNPQKLDQLTTVSYNHSLTPSVHLETDKAFRISNCKTSPNGTPLKEALSDRFIPFRLESIAKKLFDMPEESTSTNSISDTAAGVDEMAIEKEQSNIKYQRLLEDKVLGVKPLCFPTSTCPQNSTSPSSQSSISTKSNYILKKLAKPINDNTDDKPILNQQDMMNTNLKLLKFKHHYANSPNSFETMSNACLSPSILPFTLDSLSGSSPMNTRQSYKIPDKPFKVLEAPKLEDDFYLNLIDWSSSNKLGVILQSSVYLWSPSTCLVEKLCQSKNPSNKYTSISWDHRGGLIALGNTAGRVEIWDGIKMKLLRDDMESHTNRIGCISWSHSGLIVTGSRDKNIIMRDLRVKSQESTICKYIGHKQEVCGLKWSPNDRQIASGGNDNNVFIWSMHKPTYEAKFTEHTSAVKALAWSPHQNGLLVTGGGSNDKSIKFWNTLTYKCIKSKTTSSQVCNIMFSKNSNEFVSTHGFSNHQIIIWKYPELTQVSTLEGHNTRVLYLSMSPDGETIVTGAGDETLRFWNAFPPRNSLLNSPLLPSALDLR